MKMLYAMIGSPLVVGVDQSIVTMSLVTLVIGAAASLDGLVAHRIETGVLSTLYPNLFRDSTLKL
jgi:hypothetical protein